MKPFHPAVCFSCLLDQFISTFSDRNHSVKFRRELAPELPDVTIIERKMLVVSIALRSGPDVSSTQYHEMSHEEDARDDADKICVARVDDGGVLSPAVLGEDGRLDVALPASHEAVDKERVMLTTYRPPRPCDATSFRPGYYGQQQSA